MSEIKLPQQAGRKRNIFFTFVFLCGFLCCLPVGLLPQYTTILSIAMLGCICINFFSDHFFLYAAIFMFMRYKMMIGETPVYRIYSYMVVIKFILELPRFKLRLVYLPAILVFALHSIFATGAENMRLGLNVIVDIIIIYVILMKVLADDRLMRYFLVAFMLGAVTSGIYGYTAADATHDTIINGAVVEVTRRFGSLSDANFACLFYISAIFTALILKGIPRLLRVVFAGFFFVLLLQTASLTGILTCALVGMLALVLRFRKKAIFIFLGALVAVAILLSIPAVREIEAIASILLRISERLHYLSVGRWDMLTTGRTDLWRDSLALFNSKPLLGKLFGGSVITIALVTTRFRGTMWGTHQSVIQGLLNFGILGTVVVFGLLFATFFYRFLRHMFRPAGYANEDIKILQLLFSACFIIMSMTVDMFLDWTFLFFYFI